MLISEDISKIRAETAQRHLKDAIEKACQKCYCVEAQERKLELLLVNTCYARMKEAQILLLVTTRAPENGTPGTWWV